MEQGVRRTKQQAAAKGAPPLAGAAESACARRGVRPEFPDRVDHAVTRWLVRRWGRSASLDATMAVWAEWTPVVLMMLIVAASLGLGVPPARRPGALADALTAVAAAVCGRLLNEPVTRWARRPRPFEQLGLRPLLGHPAGDSFPSNHATGAFALAVSLWPVPGYGWVALGLAILLCVSRVYTGLHHASDVVAGALHGTACAWLAAWVGRWLFGWPS